MSAQVYDAVVDVLAVYRITHLVVDDEITSDLRNWWYERHDPSETKLGYLVSCPWCVGFWAAAGAVAARRLAPEAWSSVAHAFALSGAVGLLYTRGHG